jgi:hypothetical protein
MDQPKAEQALRALDPLVGTWSIEAPDTVSVIGCDAANRRYVQVYTDDRSVCRIYEMTFGDGRWTLQREGEPFAQRFTATFGDDGRTITGRWQLAEEGQPYENDFDLVYRRIDG